MHIVAPLYEVIHEMYNYKISQSMVHLHTVCTKGYTYVHMLACSMHCGVYAYVRMYGTLSYSIYTLRGIYILMYICMVEFIVYLAELVCQICT